MTILVDDHEPRGEGAHLHPWAPRWPAGTKVIRGSLDAGSLALAALPDGAVVKHCTVAGFLAVMGKERAPFEHELARSRRCGSFAIIVEGDLEEVIVQARGLKQPAIMATVATWSRRYGPILFAGGQHAAADLAYRFLAGQVREVERAAKAIKKAEAATP